MSPRSPRPKILCVDSDRDIAEVVQAILSDEGYAVSCLYDVTDDAMRRTVGELEPDCILLDGVNRAEYGSWEQAAWIERRGRAIPVVMFTGHHLDVLEAREGTSPRAQAARFAAVIEKPFHLDELLKTVAAVVELGTPFDASPRAERARTRALVGALARRGATDIAPSTRREWATFRDRAKTVWQIYWWQTRGAYQVGRYDPEGVMAMVGQFTELQAAIEVALPEQ